MFPEDVDTWLRKNLDSRAVPYLESGRAKTLKVLSALGVPADSQLAHLYTQYGAETVRGWYELNEVDTLEEWTEYAHSELEVPKKFIAVTSVEGQGIALFNKETGTVTDVEFGQFEELEEGTLPPTALSIVEFLRCMRKTEES